MMYLKELFDVLFQMLFIDTKTGQASHTKFWSNVGYGAMTFTFVYAVMHGTTVDAIIWALFGVVVIGNRTVLKLFQGRSSSDKNTESLE